MSSGPQDSANVIYFNNTHYNDTTEPIQSYHKSDLRASFITDGSNYQIAINKLKISSLDGVQFGDIPIDTWQIGLEVSDKATSNIYTQLGYVSPTGNLGTGEYEEYYSIPQSTGNIVLYKTNGVLPPSQLINFQPLDNASNIVYPLNSFYDYNIENFFVVSSNGVYVYSNVGAHITQSSYTNIVNSNYNVENGVLVVCDSDYSTQSFNVVLITLENNVLTPNIITSNTAGLPLTNLTCADTDGTLIICGYNSNQITTYNYTDRSPIVDVVLQEATNVTNILIDSATNKFTYVDDDYIPYLMVSNGNPVAPNWIDVQTGAEKINATWNILSTINNYDLYQFASDATNVLLNNTSYQALTPAQNFNTFGTAVPPPYINNAIDRSVPGSLSANSILMALGPGTQLDIFTSGADNNFVNEYQIVPPPITPTGPLSKASQIVQDSINGYFYVVFGNQPGCSLSYKIIKSVGIPSIQDTRPCFTYALTGNTAWQYIDTNVNIDSMIIDPNYTNVFWAVENNIIYKGYLINNSYINFVQWYKNLAVGENWNSYITQPFVSASYNPVQVVSQNLLTNFSRVNAINAIDPVNTNYTYIQQAIRKNLLYVVNGTTISKYNYENLTFLSNIAITAPTGLMGQTTSYRIPANTVETAVYSMGEYITAFNNTFQSLFNLFSGKNISTLTAPNVEVNYITHFGQLNFDVNWSDVGYGVYVNPALYKYLKFPATLINDSNSPFNGMYKYTLNQTGILNQNQFSFYLLNQIDKILILTNLPILGDFSGLITQTRTFTDLDLDTSDIFFTGTGNILYDPQLLRKYDIVSNVQINTIQYEFRIQYKNGVILPYYIPPGENVSIKLEFDRVY